MSEYTCGCCYRRFDDFDSYCAHPCVAVPTKRLQEHIDSMKKSASENNKDARIAALESRLADADRAIEALAKVMPMPGDCTCEVCKDAREKLAAYREGK